MEKTQIAQKALDNSGKTCYDTNHSSTCSEGIIRVQCGWFGSVHARPCPSEIRTPENRMDAGFSRFLSPCISLQSNGRMFDHNGDHMKKSISGRSSMVGHDIWDVGVGCSNHLARTKTPLKSLISGELFVLLSKYMMVDISVELIYMIRASKAPFPKIEVWKI